MDNLSKAKALLILDHPFFASLLLSMPMTEDKTLKTMATNGDEIFYNPEWVASLTQQETLFVLAHETLHCAFEHMYRKGARDHNRWNIAADYVINDLLVNERLGSMIKGGLHDPALVLKGKGTAEGVYSLLPDSPPNNGPGKGKGQGSGYPSPGEPGGSMDDVRDGGKDEAERAEKEADMRVKVAQAANAAKMCGKLSSGLERLVKDALKPKVDWRAVLRRFLSERAKTDLTYARPKRRWLGEDLILPSLSGERMGGIAVAVDCSGSIDAKLLAEFAAEIRSIVEDVQPLATHVIYFDSRVLRTETFTVDDSVSLSPIGGGGTAFSPIFTHIESMGVDASACVVLTDLCCNDFGPAPSYPVLWASTEDGKAPWGEVLRIKR